MDCKSSNNGNKKLIQARLPFKRLNPEPKENQPPKRPCAHACPEPTDREDVSSSLLVHKGPPLVNGRGPLDGFLSSRHSAAFDENVVIDLTEDNTSSSVKCLVSHASASPSLLTKDKYQGKDKCASSEKSSNVDHSPKTHTLEEVDEKDGNETESSSQLDTTQDCDSEPEEQNESGIVSSLGNKSMLSVSSVSSMSESSPEKSKTDDPTPTNTPTVCIYPISLQEQEERFRLQQEKERQKEEAKAAKEKKKEEVRKLKEECKREKREQKEKDEREKREKKEKEKAERLKYVCLQRLKAEKAEITRFLQKPKLQQAPKTLAAACGKFAPFEIKENMSLAPLCRVHCEDSVLEELYRYLLNPADNLNGLKDWIGQKPRRSGPTKPRQKDSLRGCITLKGPKPEGVPDRKRYGPMKLLQFHENYRPAYWGTWNKKSSHISPRCPFRQDKVKLVCKGMWYVKILFLLLINFQEDEEEGVEDDDDDDGFFVPHGYLSDDEGALEEEEGGDLEKQKLRQKLKAREWDELMSTKKKMKVLEPVVRGCVWDGEGPGLELFQPYAVCLFEPLPKTDTSPGPEELSQKLLYQLLPLLHGNVNSSKVIITEFQELCRQQTSSSSSPLPPLIQLKRLIRTSAVYEKRSTYRRCCWYVHPEVLSCFGLEALPVPCQWTYLTTGAREDSREEPQAATGSQGSSPTTPQTSSTLSSSNKRKSTGSMSITKFMKRCTDPEQVEKFNKTSFSFSFFFSKSSSREGDNLIDVTPSDTAVLPVASAAPTPATA
uniref:Chromatin assembly factor 1 subunit p150 C-terminal domain-containing protein n=1 Tax=Monopterus albus TaxID=43700 RepID=A0A3Q3KCP8_MONAL